MKTLVYGIDGIDVDILKRLSPKFAELISTMHVHEINDDTLGRGWTKIYSGQPPQITNAYFQMPVADKSYKIDKSYSLRSPGAKNDGRFEYLWDVGERLGLKTVFVNTPTTSPAPAKGAAFISGIGGGRYPQDGIDKDLYHPADLESLIDSKYKLDMRLNKNAISIGSFCDSLNETHNSQSQVFTEICVSRAADLGFYVNKVTIELLFLAYYDLNEMQNADPEVHDALSRHFEAIYNDFNDIVERCDPEHIILVSDHGTAAYKYDFNLDLLLVRLGFLSFVENKRKESLRKKVASHLPNSLKSKLKSRMNLHNKRHPLRTPTAQSVAFSTVFDTGNFCGVYLNDNRFGGLTRSKDPDVVANICNTLNSTPEFSVLGLSAGPYAGRDIDSPYASGSPDIHISKPDEVFCQKNGDAILSINPNYGPISPDITRYNYPNSGVKSSRALLVSNYPASTIPESLCDAYHLIVQSMEETQT